MCFHIFFQILDYHLENHFFNFKQRGFCVCRDQLLMLQMRVSFICLGPGYSCFILCVIIICLSIAGSASSVQIHWYIMTSPFTDEATRKFFESHKYFGLDAEQVRCLLIFFFYQYYLFYNSLLICLHQAHFFNIQVTFFRQGTIPCVSKDGRIILETPYRVRSHYFTELKPNKFSYHYLLS